MKTNLTKIVRYGIQAFTTKRIKDKKIFFLHIPKCGGTSLQNAIMCCYGPFDRVLRRHWVRLDGGAAGRVGKALDKDKREVVEDLLLYYMNIPEIKFIYGHVFFSEKVFREAGDEWKFITVLREPVAKWFSAYYFGKYYKGPFRYRRITEELPEFLETQRAVNLGCDYIKRVVDPGEFEDCSSNLAINSAIKRLEKFQLVGILEKMDDTLNQFERVFESRPKIFKDNKGPVSKKKSQEVSNEISEKVEKLCEPNKKIYEHFHSRV